MEEVPVNCNFNPKEPIIINSVTVLVNPYAIPEENEENEELYKTEDMNKAKQHLALLCLGEIGREKGLSFHQNVENIVMEYFKSPSKEIRSAASYALGNIAAGNTSKYLPLIMDQITYRQKKLYPLFDSLKEVLIRNSMDKADFNVDKLFQFLLDHSHSEADGVTDLISQCLGKIVLNKPNELLTKLEMHIESQSAQTRLAAVNAIKYALAKWPQQMDEILYRVISSFPKRLEDDDWRVRRATVLALSTAAESKPLLFRRLIPPLLPLLDQGTFTKLRREVYFGASSEIVDDGGELRTAIINCADSLVDPSILIPYLLIRLKDYQDIDVSFQLLSKLAHTCPSPLLAGVPWNRVLVQSDAFQELLRR